MKTETIQWHELPADGMPDAETTVLLEVRDLDGSGSDVVTGWLAESGWVDIAAWPIKPERVVAWAEMPGGAAAC